MKSCISRSAAARAASIYRNRRFSDHAPLIIAEQFGTLESLYPGRIDLGLGRAPGTDQLTMLALQRDRPPARCAPPACCSMRN